MVGQIFAWHCFVSAQLRVFKSYFVLCIIFIILIKQNAFTSLCCVLTQVRLQLKGWIKINPNILKINGCQFDLLTLN